ncbi:hypothetical protein LTS03_002171 [Exophiala xenobiotica]|nr:hypothetical protein LTR61_002986 [Exophiala xenobiotica]KAK5379810.1 hypothetical protein LTR11_003438 [Exophiala xenobiotica]KAK5386897.1 hypothetical protein LTS03_002171 [Exophiala xenobiotica]
MVISIQFIFTFITVEANISIAPMFPLLAEEFHLNQTQLNLLTGVVVIANGYSNFLIIPFSNILGRRAALLIFGVIICVSNLWGALATSHASFLAARALVGIAGGTTETIMVQMVTDMFFLHERGFWMGVYFSAYFMGLFIGPVISGNIAERHGWRSFFWLSLGLTVFCLIGLLALSPETKYHRDAVVPTAAPSEVAVTETTRTEDIPNSGKATQDTCTGEHIEGKGDIETETSLKAKRDPEPGFSVARKGCPSRRQFAIIQRPDSRWKSFLVRDLFSPLHVFFFPIILWAGLNVAGPANVVLFYNLTESSVLSSPPYHFSEGAVGYSNFAFVVGGLLGMLTAGPLSDWTAHRLTLRNGGVREAEMRLPALIPYGILTTIGIVVGSIAYERQYSWPFILIFGFGLAGLSVTSVAPIAIAYAVDCYKPISGEIMVCATVIKNTCGFVMAYWVPPLVARKGLLTVGMVELALTVGPLLLGIPMYFWGRKFRVLTRSSIVHRMEAEI